ncbi:hypothetical protein ONZ43_g4550 [Nemania bipapillata]|uniref:Uncharacterized protein n=1 Tax=Nemania bipapillata TaxID=110536 RepID=A0ACC2ILC0_9PEZI|nr:hypothetical protein ONZ43_g4550 [Nemania bipapillata]
MTPPTQVPYLHGQFSRVGGWLPPDPKILIGWVRKLVAEMEEKRRWSGPLGPKDRAPAIQAFDDVVQSSAKLRMLAAAMLDEVPNKKPYLTDPVGNKQIRDYDCLLDTFQHIMTTKAPEWNMCEYKIGLIACLFNAILDWPMATPSGYAFFLDQQVNEKLRDILNTWGDGFLATEASLYVITEEPGGWLSSEALQKLEEVANLEGQTLKFFQIFTCDPSQKYWGFKSWDDFFVRTFNTIDSLRPVYQPDNPKWIVNSCESQPFALQMNVKEHDTFWLKGQPYSVAEMIPSKPEYVDDPNIGFVGAVYVGMADVSSCDINKKFLQKNLPQPVEKGDEIGMFHFGGSTHCLLFEKGVKLAWVGGADPSTAKRNLPVRSALAYPYDEK